METTTNKTQFPNIKRELEKKNQTDLKYQLDKINKSEEEIIKAYSEDKFNHKDLNEVLSWSERNTLNKRSSYSGTTEERKLKIEKALKNKYAKSLISELNNLKQIEEAEPLKNHLIITVEWKKSHMWGKNPSAEDNFNNVSGSIGGCGYDKLSTATARILNKHLYLIKLMCQKEEERLKQISKNTMVKDDIKKFLSRRSFIGYGSGNGIIPRFEGGVGVECHLRILKTLGFEANHITSTANTNVFYIKREGV